MFWLIIATRAFRQHNAVYQFEGTKLTISNVINVTKGDFREQCQINNIKYQDIVEITMNSVKIIDNHVFESCYGLTSLFIPKSVEIIGHGAVMNCHNLADFAFEQGIQLSVFPSYLFSGCNKLKKVIIPKSVTKFMEAPFNSYSLEEIIFEEGINFTIIPKEFTRTSSIKSFTVPKCVRVIDTYAFLKNKYLENIFFEKGRSESLTFKTDCFNGCEAIQSIVFPKESIVEPYALSHMFRLIKISFEDGTTIKRFGPLMLSNIWNLIEVKIPGSIESIDQTAFDFCKALEVIKYCGMNQIDEKSFVNHSRINFIYVKRNYPYPTIFGLQALNELDDKCEYPLSPMPSSTPSPSNIRPTSTKAPTKSEHYIPSPVAIYDHTDKLDSKEPTNDKNILIVLTVVAVTGILTLLSVLLMIVIILKLNREKMPTYRRNGKLNDPMIT